MVETERGNQYSLDLKRSDKSGFTGCEETE